MVRDQIKVDIPNDWMENMKHGRCWCGKDHTKFEKGQKFYCNQQHASDYSKRIQYWSNFKDHALERDNNTCVKCGTNEKLFKAEQDKLEKQFYKEQAKLYPKAIEASRSIKLKELQEEYENIMDDGYVMQHIHWKVTETYNVPRIYYEKQYFGLEVDHKKPVALGGDMWDIDNLQTLCYGCHKVKTKEDMNEIKKAKKAEITVT